ncbi:LolA family protein [Aquisalinus flavus]|uniref:Outer-membrane lipoprotein carrier protein n=1 Tax=Aquisalinus flavus TaxID=1526572 RepID=A0A8J2V741_9PROT|nr:outer membrane lipoprotein carrier protein LolA [Aquisalinus flavus]MBD0425708.1 outer membrane lipoprotein carrier protein LolA [Aquisalinus flavus]UNE48680.1 outer membrane lipoprotein carrier protein LolA [Aquisalinus flavus]GGD13919.1 outer-membrane lipoprotein carrier protein [Aquisalinus flavus]
MTISALYPCLSVFALATATPAAAAPATAAATVLVQDDAQDDLEPMAEPRDLTKPPELAPERTGQSTGPATMTPIDQEGADLQEPEGVDNAVFADLSDDEIFAKAVAYLQGIDTMQARFTQIAPSGNITEGTMQLARPGRLRFEYDQPVPTLIVANQGLVYVHDSELETTDSYPVNKTPLKFLLAEQIDSADAELTAVNRQADTVSLTLESTDIETEGQLVLEFAAPELQLVRWAVYDPRGGVTVVELHDPQTGVRIANNAFRAPEAGGSFLRDR